LLVEREYSAPAGFEKNSVVSSQQYEQTIMLEDLRGKDYDDPLWQQYIEQFTVDEMINFVSDMGY
jgi:beta-glucosidase